MEHAVRYTLSGVQLVLFHGTGVDAFYRATVLKISPCLKAGGSSRILEVYLGPAITVWKVGACHSVQR